MVTTPSPGVCFLTLDMDSAPLDNMHIRPAIAPSLDRAGLVSALPGGNGQTRSPST